MFTTYYFVNCLRLQRYALFRKVQLKFVSCVFLNVSCIIKPTYLAKKKGIRSCKSPLYLIIYRRFSIRTA